jgi:hypothetical protein
VVANPGTRAVDVRLTSLGTERAPVVSTFTVPPSRQVIREVPAGEWGSSAAIDYFGGWVGAAAVVSTGSEEPATAASRCAASPHPVWYLADGTTSRGEASFAVVSNPFASDAAVEVLMRTEGRAVNPGSLSPLVVPARSSVGIRLNDFVLQGPRERTVTVQIAPSLGRVVVGGFGVTADGLRGEAGLPAAQDRWSFPAGPADSWVLPALNPGLRAASMTVISQTARKQEIVPELSEVALAAEAVHTFVLPDLGSAGLVVESLNDVPVAAVARLEGPGGDLATMNGAGRAYRRWLVMPSLSPAAGGGSTSMVVLENPGLAPARAVIRLIGRRGVVAGPDPSALTIPSGRTVLVKLPSGPQGAPLSAVVEATDGTIVAGSASYSDDGAGYSVTLGLPIL